jgi:hypothetical protein
VSGLKIGLELGLVLLLVLNIEVGLRLEFDLGLREDCGNSWVRPVARFKVRFSVFVSVRL